MSDDYRVMLRKIKTIYVKKINCDLLYVKMLKFLPFIQGKLFLN